MQLILRKGCTFTFSTFHGSIARFIWYYSTLIGPSPGAVGHGQYLAAKAGGVHSFNINVYPVIRVGHIYGVGLWLVV